MLSLLYPKNKSFNFSSSSVWREDDPVHLTAAAHGDIAAVLANQAQNTSGQSSQGPIRKRLLSVVPARATEERRLLREPDKISGQLRSSRGRFQRGQRGHEGHGRGPWRGPRHYPY